MSFPKVAVIWINFNSAHIWKYVEASLKAVFSLEYPNYEVILVDNGSTDGSCEAIENWIRKNNPEVQFRFIKLRKNLGFTGGANLGYRNKSKDAKYVALINNDAIPDPSFLSYLVSYLETHEDVGAIQGILVNKETMLIDSCGGFLNEFLFSKNYYEGKDVRNIKERIYVTYVEGTMPIYRVKAVEKAMNNENLFISGAFVYWLEDCLLGLRLWNYSYKSIVLPKIVGFHGRQLTIKEFGSSLALPYFSLRNWFSLWIITNSRFKALLPFVMVLIQIKKVLRKEKGYSRGVLLSLNVISATYYIRLLTRAIVDGIILGFSLKRLLGKVNIYKAPVLRGLAFPD